MRSVKLLVALLLVFGMVSVVACDDLTGSSVVDPAPAPEEPGPKDEPEQPGAKVEPEQPPEQKYEGLPPGPFQDLMIFFDQLDPDQQLEWEDLLNACANDPACLEQLTMFEEFLRGECPGLPGCSDLVAAMLYRDRSSAQRGRGTYTSDYPEAWQVKDSFLAASDAAAAADAGGEQDPFMNKDYVQMLILVSEALRGEAAMIDMPGLLNKVKEADPVAGEQAAAEVEETINNATPEDFTKIEIIDQLREGGKVDGGDAADVLTEVIDYINKGADAGGAGADAGDVPPVGPDPIKDLVVWLEDPNTPSPLGWDAIVQHLVEEMRVEPETMRTIEEQLMALQPGDDWFEVADRLLHGEELEKVEVIELFLHLQ